MEEKRYPFDLAETVGWAEKPYVDSLRQELTESEGQLTFRAIKFQRQARTAHIRAGRAYLAALNSLLNGETEQDSAPEVNTSVDIRVNAEDFQKYEQSHSEFQESPGLGTRAWNILALAHSNGRLQLDFAIDEPSPNTGHSWVPRKLGDLHVGNLYEQLCVLEKDVRPLYVTMGRGTGPKVFYFLQTMARDLLPPKEEAEGNTDETGFEAGTQGSYNSSQ